MNYKKLVSDLLNKGLIKSQPVDFDQTSNLLRRAKKDLDVAKRNLEIDEEVTYTYAYLAMLRCGRALMFLKGYRPSGGQQHKTVIDFITVILDPRFSILLKKFDIMRRKRNQFTYDPMLAVSQVEAENALQSAEAFVAKIAELIRKENPQLGLDF